MGKFSLGTVLAEQEAKVTVSSERTPEVIAEEIQQLKITAGGAILEIGRRLIEAKQQLSHGKWLSWLEMQADLSERTAQEYMFIFQHISNPRLVADLGKTKALVLASLPMNDQDSFAAEAHIIDGEEKTIYDMSARQLKQAIRDREEALAEKDLAEQARAKMAEDMAMTKQLLEAAQEARDAALREIDEQKETAKASEQEVARITQELEALKAAPKDVAVMEVDQAALDQARAEAVAEMQDKLDKAKAAQTKEVEKRKQAEAALEEANAKLEAAVKAEKQAAVAGNKELASFEAYFTQAQEIKNIMRGLLLKVRGRNDSTNAGVMERAMLALSKMIEEAAQ